MERWLECARCGLADSIEHTNIDPYECGRCEFDEYVVVKCGCAAHCVMCGCGDGHACPVIAEPETFDPSVDHPTGCSWVPNPLNCGPLCSECLPRAEQLHVDLAVLEVLGLIDRVLVDAAVAWAPTERATALRPG